MLSDKEAKDFVFASELGESLRTPNGLGHQPIPQDSEDFINNMKKYSQSALNRQLAVAPKSLRQGLLRDNPDSNEGQTSATIEIQRAWRGYLARANLFNLVEPGVSKTAVYSGSKHTIMRQDDFKGFTGSGKEKNPGRQRLEEYYKDFIQGLMMSDDRPNILPSFEDFCATYIQDWWKDRLLRQRDRLLGRQPSSRKPVPVEPIIPKRPVRKLNVQEAAAMIQKAWRRHIDIQVYRYYRDLINFKTRGNPSLMLRCINPLEAKMLDPAAGIHIKFRLAGERFPPNIYYKIYTHRPIQDLCANSPKDYTKPAVKIKMAKDQHNRGRFEVNKQDISGWYQRMDNNGWRLVSDRLIHHIMSDPVTWETSKKKYEYHHDKGIEYDFKTVTLILIKLQRKQDVEKRKKKKKIDWMKKMYKDGMLKAKSDDKETIQLIEGAAAGMVATVENYGSDALEDWEVDELLDWTTSLNFEDYQSGWKELATSANSEKQIEDKMRLLTSTGDPYEFTLSTGPSRYQSTQQSRNTPVSSVSSTAGRQQQAVS